MDFWKLLWRMVWIRGKMNKFGFFKLVLFVLLLVCAGFSSRVRADSEIIKAFIPTSGWLVGPATLISKAGVTMPCVMANQYNNGYFLRFSGGNNRIMAIAVDFRNDIFETGRQYDFEIGISPHFKQKVIATAYDSGTILMNMQKQAGFYEVLAEGQYLDLAMGGVKVSFALPGIRDGLIRIEQCYNPSHGGENTKTGAVGALLNKNIEDKAPLLYVKQMKAENEILPTSETEKMLEVRMSAVEAMLKDSAAELAELSSASGSEKALSEKAGSSPSVGKPPVNNLLSSIVKPKEGMHQRDIIVAANAEKTGQPQIVKKRWRVIKGMDLHETLDIWAQGVNARLLWKAKNEYAAIESFSLQGTFEEAVLVALEQHENLSGQIFIDPVLNQKVLVIEDGGVR